MIGDWVCATAVTVWAYDAGGAAAVGIWATIRLAMVAVITPFAAALADRFPRPSWWSPTWCGRCW